MAIMQPYLFPYIGYYQLISAVDRYVIADDYAFIKHGWINRNRILLRGQPHMFTIPLVKKSSNMLICDTKIINSDWKDHLIRTMLQAYNKTPHYNDVMPLVSDIIHSPSQTIDTLAFESIKRISDFLDIDTEFIRSTRIYGNRHLKGQERGIDICLQEKTTLFINAPGGRSLYSHEDFLAKGITLRFLDTLPHQYRQFGEEFHPHLSIIDVLMFCGSEGTKALLQKYKLAR